MYLLHNKQLITYFNCLVLDVRTENWNGVFILKPLPPASREMCEPVNYSTCTWRFSHLGILRVCDLNMASNQRKPIAKKLKLDYTVAKQQNSINKDTGAENLTNKTGVPSGSSRDVQPKKPRAILHDMYHRLLETSE